MRCTLGSCAAARITPRWVGVQTCGIDVEPVGAHHHDRGHFLALVARQSPVRHRRQPDVGVEPDLMAGVAGQHRAAARLRHVADQDSRPAGVLARLGRQPRHQRDQVRMPPIAVARQPHHLPALAIDRQRFGAGDAALGIEADHARRHRRRQHLAAEQFLGAELRIVGIGQRRQRLWIDAALVLRQRRGGADDGCGISRRVRIRRGFIGSLCSGKPSTKSAAGEKPRQAQVTVFVTVFVTPWTVLAAVFRSDFAKPLKAAD